jgi:alpha-galactosidase
LLVSTEIVDLSEEKKSILMNKEVLAVHSDSLFVAGERIAKDDQGRQVWTRPLANGDYAAILYNANNVTALPITMSWTDLGWKSTDQVLVRDLWAQNNVGVYPKGYAATVGANDVQFVRLTKQN